MNFSQPTLMTIPFALFGLLATQATAQPPEGGPGRGGPLRAIMQALDANQDQELSASEIENATAALKAIDKNGDGVINKDDASGRPEGGRGKAKPDGAGNAAKDDGKKDGKGNPVGRRAGKRKAGEGAAGEGKAGPGRGKNAGAGNSDRGRAGRRGSQFVKNAMEFDADGDGKLSQDELSEFANNMPGPQAGEGGPGGPNGPGGRRGPRGGQGGGQGGIR